MSEYVIGIVGNPNCGKTTLFNALTGAKQRVGNWPGVTVERKSGEYIQERKRIEVVDLPGIYSLSAASLDEAVARNYLLSGEADLIVNIVDASNLERNFYLTVQLLEMKAPLVVALNMMDLAHGRGLKIDIEALAERLGCPVVPLSASRKEGIRQLKSVINQVAGEKNVSPVGVTYPAEIEAALAALLPEIREAMLKGKMDPRWGAVKLLEADPWVAGKVSAEASALVDAHLKKIEEALGEEADILVADSRYGLIGTLTRSTVKRTNRVGRTLSDKIDRIVLNRMFGIPIFLAAMYADVHGDDQHRRGVYRFLRSSGRHHPSWRDLRNCWALWALPKWLAALLAGGIGGGLQTIATFIPPIGFMFLCLCFLEDSGYMARAAFVMDRFMRVIGLPGKAFVPLLVGFGCNVPAIMATRTLENQRDRTLTIMMNPFMSCGARLPVYALFAAAFFPVGGQNMSSVSIFWGSALPS
jgi:ferrous iron transport protein B